MAKRFTQAEREKAVAKAQKSGNYEKVASDFGIKKATLKKWERDIEYDDGDFDGINAINRNAGGERGQIPSGVKSYMIFSAVIVAVIVSFSFPIGGSLLQQILSSAVIGAVIVYGISLPYLAIKYGYRDCENAPPLVFVSSLTLLATIWMYIIPGAIFWRVILFSMILSFIISRIFSKWYCGDMEND